MAKRVVTAPTAAAAEGVTSPEEIKAPVASGNLPEVKVDEDQPDILKHLKDTVYAEAAAEEANTNKELSDLSKQLEEAINGKAIAESKIEAFEKAQVITDQAILDLNNSLATANERADKAEEALRLAEAASYFKSEETTDKTFVEYNGRKYGFNDRAPKRVNFEDRFYTQDELLNNEEAMISLIVGESAFIKQVY